MPSLLGCLSPTAARGCRTSCRCPPQHVPTLLNLPQFLVSHVLGHPPCVPGKEMRLGTRGYRELRVSVGAEMTRVYQRVSGPSAFLPEPADLRLGRFILLRSGISFSC